MRVLARADLGPHLAHRELWVMPDGERIELKPFADRPQCARVWSRDAKPALPSPPRNRRPAGAMRPCRLEQLPVDAIPDGGPLEQRPTDRRQCRDGPRPCPWVGCGHHLYLDVLPSGAVRVPHPEIPVWEMTETCVLDIADRGEPLLLEQVAEMLAMTSERVRQVEARALSILREQDDSIDAETIAESSEMQVEHGLQAARSTEGWMRHDDSRY